MQILGLSVPFQDPGRNTRVNIIWIFHTIFSSLRPRFSFCAGGGSAVKVRMGEFMVVQGDCPAVGVVRMLARATCCVPSTSSGESVAPLDSDARARLDLRRQIVKVRMLERVFGGYPLGGVVLQHLCYQGEAARIELWAEDIEREPRLGVLAPFGLEFG